MLNILGVCGNPVPSSKTLTLTTEVVAAVADAVAGRGSPRSTDPVHTDVVDLSSYGGKVLAWGDEEVGEARALVAGADLVVVSTPVYKGAYTGLLKGFLDGYGAGALAGTVAVPLTVAASPAHALAGPAHLEPVLTELGLLVAGGTLHVPDQVAADPQRRAALVAEWIAPRARLLATVAGTGAR